MGFVKQTIGLSWAAKAKDHKLEAGLDTTGKRLLNTPVARWSRLIPAQMSSLSCRPAAGRDSLRTVALAGVEAGVETGVRPSPVFSEQI